jgi:hypothetical protein
MNKDEAITALREAISKILVLRTSRAYGPEHVQFIQSTGLEIERIFGPDSPISINFAKISYQYGGHVLGNPFNIDSIIERKNHIAYLEGLDIAEGILSSAIEQLLKYGADRILTESRIRRGEGSVFISHGKETPALRKVERFIRALGLQPVIVILGASEGLSVDDLVEKRMSESDCALILATVDDQVEGLKQPRLNVIHEIGMAQEKFGNKVIYLKENGCEFPSNVRPKVWENFSQDNMEVAFEKISKELRAFGLI